MTINDLTRKYINNFDISKKTIPEAFTKIFYTNIETIVNEYIIRAITIRLFEQKHEDKTVGYLIADNIKKGFKNIESVKDYIVKNCEQNNKLVKDCGYENLLRYVINKI